MDRFRIYTTFKHLECTSVRLCMHEFFIGDGFFTLAWTRYLSTSKILHRNASPIPACVWYISMDSFRSCRGRGRKLYLWKPEKHNISTQCWFKVGPASTTPAEHQTSIGSMFRYVCPGLARITGWLGWPWADLDGVTVRLKGSAPGLVWIRHTHPPNPSPHPIPARPSHGGGGAFRGGLSRASSAWLVASKVILVYPDDIARLWHRDLHF